MILKQLRDDTRGATLVEFTVTVPFFMLLMFGLLQTGLLLWTKAGLQHGVEVATRCASVNYSANQLGSPVSTTPSCFGVAPSTVCGSPPGCNSATATPYIKNYASQNSFGLVPSISHFTVTQALPPGGSCPTTVGYVVTASAPYNLINYIFSVTLTATSKFSITCS
jgi:Flp pilus assembly pilin Flp